MKKEFFGAPEDCLAAMCWLRDKGFTRITLELTKYGWLLHCGYRYGVKTSIARDKSPESLGFNGDFTDTYYISPSDNQPNLYWWAFD